MERLKDFMLLFRFEPQQEPPTPGQLNEMHQQWSSFIRHIATQGKLVSTHQLGFEGKQIVANQSIHEGIHLANKQTISGNMILKAINIEEALDWAQKCPILLMGGSVEIRNILPMTP
jgi:hypothetical protein